MRRVHHWAGTGGRQTAGLIGAAHVVVCGGTLTLQEVQQIISTDWFKCYRDQVLK
jgi:hypothetical protein